MCRAKLSHSDYHCNGDIDMQHDLWNYWYLGLAWLLWLGVMLLFFSNLASRGYSCVVHGKGGHAVLKEAIDVLNQPYVRGQITREQLNQMKTDLASSI